VTRTALQNAASIAALMLTTEALVHEVPERRERQPPARAVWAGTCTEVSAAALRARRFPLAPGVRPGGFF